MSRWYVYRDNEDRAWRWIAVPVHENWWERPQGRRFPQWYMAVQYANRKAKPTTLTIEDPTGAFCELTATVKNRKHIHLRSSADTFLLARHEWKPLADFLLTAADRTEDA